MAFPRGKTNPWGYIPKVPPPPPPTAGFHRFAPLGLFPPRPWSPSACLTLELCPQGLLPLTLPPQALSLLGWKLRLLPPQVRSPGLGRDWDCSWGDWPSMQLRHYTPWGNPQVMPPCLLSARLLTSGAKTLRPFPSTFAPRDLAPCACCSGGSAPRLPLLHLAQLGFQNPLLCPSWAWSRMVLHHIRGLHPLGKTPRDPPNATSRVR
jgi:hypothetical protein